MFKLQQLCLIWAKNCSDRLGTSQLCRKHLELLLVPYALPLSRRTGSRRNPTPAAHSKILRPLCRSAPLLGSSVLRATT